MKKIVIASHVTLIHDKEYDGIGNSLKATLDEMGLTYTFLRNSIDGLLASQVQSYSNGRLGKTVPLNIPQSPSVLRYIGEIWQTVRYFSRLSPIDLYVGIDPLNALSGIILKKRGKVKKAVFYTADYSPQRFSVGILNWVYHRIDAYCVKYADEVWSVSTKIVEVRRNMGLTESKNIFLPNVPPTAYDKYRDNPHDIYELVTTGILDKQLDFEGTLRAVAALSGEFPKLHLTIIGNGPEEENIKKLADELGISSRVELTGRLPLKAALYRQSRAGIGLALYTGVWGFNQYGDSTKCREYFHFGLPVISTDTHATVQDIEEYQAGIIVDLAVDQYVDAIRNTLRHYSMYEASARRLGQKYAGEHKKRIETAIK